MTRSNSRLWRSISNGLLLTGAVAICALTTLPASAQPKMNGKMMHGKTMRMKGMTMAQSKMMRKMMMGMSMRDKKAMMGMSMSEKRAMMNSMKMHGMKM